MRQDSLKSTAHRSQNECTLLRVFSAIEISYRVWIVCTLKPHIHVFRRPDEIFNRVQANEQTDFIQQICEWIVTLTLAYHEQYALSRTEYSCKKRGMILWRSITHEIPLHIRKIRICLLFLIWFCIANELLIVIFDSVFCLFRYWFIRSKWMSS